jgi:RimJ/RimL family protein N-acetyltransferase
VFRPRTVRLRDGRRAVIRRATPRDAEGIIAHVNAIGAERVYIMTETLRHSPREERALLRKWNADRDSELFLVAVGGGGIVGTANFSRGRQFKNRHVAVLGVALGKDWRGVGLGRTMMEAGIDWARSVGIRKLTLGVFASNRRALALYRKLGFRVEGRLRGQVILQRHRVDEVLMARWI